MYKQDSWIWRRQVGRRGLGGWPGAVGFGGGAAGSLSLPNRKIKISLANFTFKLCVALHEQKCDSILPGPDPLLGTQYDAVPSI